MASTAELVACQGQSESTQLSLMQRRTTLRSVIFTRLLMLVGSAVLLLTLGFAVFGLQPLHDRLAGEEFRRIADGVKHTVEQTVTAPASLLPPASDLIAELPPALDEPLRIERLFRSLLHQHPDLGSVVFGTEDGRGWALIRMPDGSWRSRITHRTLWRDLHLIIDEAADGSREGRIESLPYDARTRPWYKGALQGAEGELHWTPPYSFYTTAKPGVTASGAFASPTARAPCSVSTSPCRACPPRHSSSAWARPAGR